MTSISPTQHCTFEPHDGESDYTFSHTAGYCGRPQPRRCGCAFCYPAEDNSAREALIDVLLRAPLIETYDWLGTGSRYPSDESIRDEVRELADFLIQEGYGRV